MKDFFRHLFIPHKDNNHTPHMFRETAVGILFVVIVGIFGFTALHSQMLQNNHGFVAAVLPSVLTDLANEDREEEGLGQLEMDERLRKAAQLKAQHMAQRGYFGHFGPSGKSPWHWMRQAGYDYVYAGENLAVNFADSKDVQDAWMSSQLHRENILEPQFTEVGIATARGEFKGQDTIFVVQMFGAPQPDTTLSSREQSAGGVKRSSEDASEVAGASVSAETDEEGADISTSTKSLPKESNNKVSTSTSTSTSTEDNTVEGGLDSPASNGPVVANIDKGQQPKVQTKNAGSFLWSFLGRLATQPTYLMQILYGMLAILIAMAMAGIAVEYRRHHIRHIFYGLGLVMVMTLFVYVSHLYLLPVPVVG